MAKNEPKVQKKMTYKVRSDSGLCLVVSSPMTVQAFLQDHLRALARAIRVTVVADSPDRRFLKPLGPGIHFHRVPIPRAISLWRDVRALLSLLAFFRSRRFLLVHSYTPKAGLLAMTAAFIAGVPERAHTFTGQVWATKKGPFRLLLKTLDRIISSLSTRILVDSPSQMHFLRREKILPKSKGEVLGAGSVSGVNLHRFRPNPAKRKKIREELGLTPTEVVFLFVGRLNRDKGIPELYEAFETLTGTLPQARLLLVGPQEESIHLPAALAQPNSPLVFMGPSSRPEDFMVAADILVLPSRREGFGSTVIEAAACGLPAVASRIYGLTDAVAHGRTGLLIRPGDVGELTQAMEKLGKAKSLRLRMGRFARHRAREKFAQEKITAALLQFYRKMILV